MSKVYCIGYSDYGFLLSEQDWNVEIRKLDGCDYGVYEDILKSGPFTIVRRFLSGLPDIFDETDKKSEPVLPEDISRLIIRRDGIDVVVISSTDFMQLFGGETKDEYGCVLTDEELISCKPADKEDLAEDVVILSSVSVDLNNPESDFSEV